MLSMNYCLKMYKLFRDLVAYFDDVMSIIRLRSKHGGCSFVSLEYACKISSQMDWYNFIYGHLVQYTQFWTVYLVLIISWR